MKLRGCPLNRQFHLARVNSLAGIAGEQPTSRSTAFRFPWKEIRSALGAVPRGFFVRSQAPNSLLYFSRGQTQRTVQRFLYSLDRDRRGVRHHGVRLLCHGVASAGRDLRRERAAHAVVVAARRIGLGDRIGSVGGGHIWRDCLGSFFHAPPGRNGSRSSARVISYCLQVICGGAGPPGRFA